MISETSRSAYKSLKDLGDKQRVATGQLIVCEVGTRFGRWTITSAPVRLGKQWGYEVICDCGTKSKVRSFSLRHGESQSCGCLAAEKSSTRNRTHGMTNTKTFDSWRSMIRRCYEEGRADASSYFDREIVVCDRWLGKEGFQNFLSDMGERPNGMTLDRIDNNLGYGPENCRWATPRTQSNNRRSNRLIAYKGRTYTLVELARKAGIGNDTFAWRLRHWKDVERCVETPPKKQKNGRALYAS